MNAQPFLVTGMVRSGTTLISRAIDAHSRIACPPETCLGFFRALRNDLLYQHAGQCGDPEAPFTDFFSSQTLPLQLFIDSDLYVQIEFSSPKKIVERIRRFTKGSADPFVDKLGKIDAEETYYDLFNTILELLRDTYGSEGNSATGFKQTWIEAFSPLLLNTFNDFHCVHIIRDPRAIVASWLKTDKLTHNYPLVMILRHWRKSAALASLFTRMYGDNYEIIRYEDFVSRPEKSLESVASSLGVSLEPSMTVFGNYRNGMKESWTSNTSYDSTSEITDEYIGRWRDRIDTDDLQFIEDFCYPELSRWNYERQTTPALPQSLMEVPKLSKQFPGDSDWIRQYKNRYKFDWTNRAKEIYRWHLRENAPELLDEYSGEYRDVFLDTGLVKGHYSE